MDEKNSIMEGFGEFLLGLVKMCVVFALLTGTVVASAFLAIQGVFVIRDKYGFYGVAITWLISFMTLLLVCGLFQEKRKQNRTRCARSEAPAENDRHSLENKKEAHRD